MNDKEQEIAILLMANITRELRQGSDTAYSILKYRQFLETVELRIELLRRHNNPFHFNNLHSMGCVKTTPPSASVPSVSALPPPL